MLDPVERMAGVEVPDKQQGSDAIKQRTIEHWASTPIGTAVSGFDSEHAQFSKEYFDDIARFRYEEYAPWLPAVAEFDRHAGDRVLEIGCGQGTDLLEFAKGGAIVTGLDLTPRHVELTRRKFELYGYEGTFVEGDAEDLPFDDAPFDYVYSNGVLHHTPDTQKAVDEAYRVLKPGGRAKIILYHRDSLHYNVEILLWKGVPELRRRLRARELKGFSRQSLLNSQTDGFTNPLTKVYSQRQARALARKFDSVKTSVWHLNPQDFPSGRRFSRKALDRLARLWGWYVVIDARKA